MEQEMRDDTSATDCVVRNVLDICNSIQRIALTCASGVRRIHPTLNRDSDEVEDDNNIDKYGEEEDAVEEPFDPVRAAVGWSAHERWLRDEIARYDVVLKIKEEQFAAARQVERRDREETEEEMAEREKETEEELHKSINALQDELFAVTEEKDRNELILRQTRYAGVVMDYHYTPPQGTLKQITEEEKARMSLLLRFRDKKALEALQLNDQLSRVKQTLEAAIQANATARLDARALFAKLKVLEKEKDKQEQRKRGDGQETRRFMQRRRSSFMAIEEDESEEEEDNDELNQDLKRKRAMNVLIREVFMALIIESGVNWAKDEQLKELMLHIDLPTSSTATSS